MLTTITLLAQNSLTYTVENIDKGSFLYLNQYLTNRRSFKLKQFKIYWRVFCFCKEV